MPKTLKKQDGKKKINLGKKGKIAISLALIFIIGLSSEIIITNKFFGTTVSTKPNFLNVSILGTKTLGVNETGTYTASVNNSQSNSLSFSWSITPQDNNTVLVADGSKCNLTFIQATTESYMLSVSVKDNVVENTGYGVITVFDPYTEPELNLDVSTAPFSYMIETDGLGWYQAVNGTSGGIVTSWSSTVPTNVINNATRATTNGIIIFEGTFPLGSPVYTYNIGTTFTGSQAMLTLTNGANCPIIVVRNSNTTITNLVLDGNLAQQTGGVAAIDIASPVQNLVVNQVTFQNVWQAGIKGVGTALTNIVNGLYVTNCKATNIQDGTSHAGGVVLVYYGTNIYVDGIIANNIGDSASTYLDCIDIQWSSKIQISHIQVYGGYGHGVFVGYGSNDTQISDVTMDNAVGTNLEAVCIEFCSSGTDIGSIPNRNVNIQNVLFIANNGGNNGMYCSDTDGLTITNYQCIVNNVALSGYAGLYMINCNYTSITNYNGVSKNAIGASGYFWASSCNSLAMSNCISSGFGGIITFSLLSCNNVTVSNSIIENSPYSSSANEAIYILTCNSVTFQGVTLQNINCMYYPIRLDAGPYNSITFNGVNIENVNIGNSYEAVYWFSNANNVLITGGIIENIRSSSGNPEYCVYTDGNINTFVVTNNIWNSSGSTVMRGFYIDGTNNQNILFAGNSINVNSRPFDYTNIPLDLKIYDNMGYNPHGLLSTPISGSYLVDSGSSSTWTSGTTYTNSGSPKVLYVSGGTVTVIAVDGTTLYTAATTCTIILQPGDTFSVTFTSAPTIKVFAQ